MGKVVQRFITAFCDVWLKGLGRLAAARKGSEQSLLGMAGKWWPQIIGLVLRIVQHMQCQMPTESGVDPSAEDLRAQISSALTSGEVVDQLEQLEAAAAANPSGARAAKRARTSTSSSASLPSDIDLVLQVYARTLEALNASRFLKPLKDSEEQTTGDDCEAERMLQDIMCRWAQVADELDPLEGEVRLAKVWSSCAFMLQQMRRCKVSFPQQIPFAKNLFDRVTEDVPAEDADLKAVVRSLLLQCQWMKDAPEVLPFLKSLLGEAGSNCTDIGDADGSELHRQDRVATS